MKITRRIFSLLVVSFLLQSANAQVSNPDTMIHKIFATLKAKDQDAFVALYPNGKQFGKMMRTMMETMFKSEAMQSMMAADEKSKNLNIDSLINVELAKMENPAVFAEMKKKFGQSFQNIIEKGEKKGVDWKAAVLTGYTMDSISLDEEDAQMFQGSGLKNMKGIIDFRVGDSAYQMTYNKVVYLPAEGGWFGGEFPQLARKGESLTEDADSEKMMGDEIVAVDTLAVKAPQKAKTKTKTPTKKIKTKTKTEATKPKTKS